MATNREVDTEAAAAFRRVLFVVALLVTLAFLMGVAVGTRLSVDPPYIDTLKRGNAMTRTELAAIWPPTAEAAAVAGHKQLSPLRAIRAKCLDCSCYQPREARQ